MLSSYLNLAHIQEHLLRPPQISVSGKNGERNPSNLHPAATASSSPIPPLPSDSPRRASHCSPCLVFSLSLCLQSHQIWPQITIVIFFALTVVGSGEGKNGCHPPSLSLSDLAVVGRCLRWLWFVGLIVGFQF